MNRARQLSIPLAAAVAFVAAWMMTPVPGGEAGLRRDIAAATPYYPGCNAARAAGAAPIYRGQPGYREEMDGDGDGIACEPHRSRW
jgi:hypothetical protein